MATVIVNLHLDDRELQDYLDYSFSDEGFIRTDNQCYKMKSVFSVENIRSITTYPSNKTGLRQATYSFEHKAI